jgi:hypothetical protein
MSVVRTVSELISIEERIDETMTLLSQPRQTSITIIYSGPLPADHHTANPLESGDET